MCTYIHIKSALETELLAVNSSFKNHSLYWSCLGQDTFEESRTELLTELLQRETLLPGLVNEKQKE